MKNKYYDINRKKKLFNTVIVIETIIFLTILYFVPTDINVKNVGQNIIIALKWLGGLLAFYGLSIVQREKFLKM